MLAWVKAEQGKHFCKCGCGGEIKIIWPHYYRGVPAYIHHHDHERRFWLRVDKDGPGGCWLWTGVMLKSGYGHLGKQGRAHRRSWVMHNGPIPDGLCVLHKCDVRPCVNPSHLFLGTRIDNTDDMTAKKRQSHGVKHYKAILDDNKVRSILARRRDGETNTQIARSLGICHKHVSLICRRKRWQHVELP